MAGNKDKLPQSMTSLRFLHIIAKALQWYFRINVRFLHINDLNVLTFVYSCMFVIHRMVERNHQLLVLLECVFVDPYFVVVVAVIVDG